MEYLPKGQRLILLSSERRKDFHIFPVALRMKQANANIKIH